MIVIDFFVEYTKMDEENLELVVGMIGCSTGLVIAAISVMELTELFHQGDFPYVQHNGLKFKQTLFFMIVGTGLIFDAIKLLSTLS